ncbi:hypothetical protein LPB41_14305 [Thalassospira sp. MA62]|nr:hypothetical protein [Thalassospira sp. MA62]
MSDDFARSVTINIGDYSAAEMILSYSTLDGGQWKEQPIPGSVIKPGDDKIYVNGADDTFTKLGGKIVLGPASGGQITITWSWAPQSGVEGSVETKSLNGIGTGFQWINEQSLRPTLQVTITPHDALATLRKV